MRADSLKRGNVSLFCKSVRAIVFVGAAVRDIQGEVGSGSSIGHVDVSVCFFTASTLYYCYVLLTNGVALLTHRQLLLEYCPRVHILYNFTVLPQTVNSLTPRPSQTFIILHLHRSNSLPFRIFRRTTQKLLPPLCRLVSYPLTTEIITETY